MKVTYNYSLFPPILIRYLNIKFQTFVYYLFLCYEFPLCLKWRMAVVKIKEILYTHTYIHSNAASSTGLSAILAAQVLAGGLLVLWLAKHWKNAAQQRGLRWKTWETALRREQEEKGFQPPHYTNSPWEALLTRWKFPEGSEVCGEPKVEKGNGMKGARTAERTTASIHHAPAPLREEVEGSGLKEWTWTWKKGVDVRGKMF